MNRTYYDSEKHLVMINNEIQENLSNFQFDWKKINVIFNNNSQIYSYHSRNIKIMREPKEIDIKNNIIYYNSWPLYDLKKVLNFSWNIRVFYNNWDILTSDKIEIKQNPLSKKEVKGIIDYFKSTLDSLKDDEEKIQSYLKKEYEKLDMIDPNSVLNDYLLKKIRKREIKSKELIYPFKFNLSQKQAIENIYDSNISIIEWPPWTWKTQTILNIIANLAIMQDKTIAVISNNNSAISNVKEKLEKEGYWYFISLLWKKENKEKFFSDVPKSKKFNIDNILNKSIKLDEICLLLEINNNKLRLESELSAYVLEKEHFDNYYNNQNIEAISKLPFFIKTSEKIMEFLAENKHYKRIWKNDSLYYKIKIFIKYWFIDFKKLKQNEVEIILNYQKKFYELKINELTSEILSMDTELKQRTFTELINDYEINSKTLFQNKLNSKFWSEDFIFDKNNYLKNFDKFIKRFPVILSTSYAILNSIPKWFLFDYIIIDESSQVDLITAILALSCCKNVIIVWDTKQLTHIANWIKEEQKDISAEYNYFDHNILSSVIAIYWNKLPKALLKEHYRCHPRIINFCNQKYYNWELIPYKSDTSDYNPLVIYRTAEWNHMREVTNSESKWRYNQRELDVIADILTTSKEINDENEDIWVIAPFRKQTEKARIMLNSSIEIDTVHKFQWREKNTIIMSTVLDVTKSWNIGMKFADKPNLINVAVSRAKNKFILVTDNELFFKKGKEIKDLVKYIEYSSPDDNVFQHETISVFDLLYNKQSNKLDEIKSKIWNDSMFKSENIMSALLKKIILLEEFDNLTFSTQILLKHLIYKSDMLTPEELSYINHNSSVDFLIYYKFGKNPLLAIEVDWFEYHENDIKQSERDKLKNSIFNKYNIPYLRLATNGSNEENIIKSKLDELLWN